MPHPHASSAAGPAHTARPVRPVVSRRRLLESGAAVLGALALTAPSGAAHAAPPAGRGRTPGVERLRRLPPRHRTPHTTLMPYAGVPQALAADRTRSPYRLDLDGTWKFAYADRPEDRDPDFHRTDTDDRDWDTIPVPSVWQLHGHDFPIYLNITYPYGDPTAGARNPGRPPRPPATTRWASTAAPSPSRATGTAAASSCTSRASSPRTTCGSTANSSATTRTPTHRPSTTSPTTCVPAPTRSPSRCTATPTATGWRTRT